MVMIKYLPSPCEPRGAWRAARAWRGCLCRGDSGWAGRRGWWRTPGRSEGEGWLVSRDSNKEGFPWFWNLHEHSLMQNMFIKTVEINSEQKSNLTISNTVRRKRRLWNVFWIFWLKMVTKEMKLPQRPTKATAKSRTPSSRNVNMPWTSLSSRILWNSTKFLLYQK